MYIYIYTHILYIYILPYKGKTEKLKKMTLKLFTCPAKYIIGRTLEIWQLDVLVMKIIYIKKL